MIIVVDNYDVFKGIFCLLYNTFYYNVNVINTLTISKIKCNRGIFGLSLHVFILPCWVKYNIDKIEP